MGTALTGSTVASTYTGLLKTTDSATLTSSLKAISDGSGADSALQISTQAVNSSGDFSVANNKLTVASASGNTAVAGTLGVTGATTLASVAVTGAATAASVATTGNISTSAGNISAPAGTITSYGAISQTQAGQNNSLAGNLAVTGNLNVTGTTSLSGNVSLPGTLNVTGDFKVNTNKFTVTASSGNTTVAGTLGVTGTTSVATINASGNATITGTLDVTATTTLGDLSTTGNTVIGNAAVDQLTVTAGAVTINNLPSKTTPISADTVLIRDSAASNSVKTSTVSSIVALSTVKFVYAEEISKNTYTGQSIVTTAGVGVPIQQNGSVTDWTYTWTPQAVGNKALIRVSVPVQVGYSDTIYVGIIKNPYSQPTDVLSAKAIYGVAGAVSNTASTETVFTSTASSHTFKILIGSSNSNTLIVAANGTGSYFNLLGSTKQAYVNFELIEFS